MFFVVLIVVLILGSKGYPLSILGVVLACISLFEREALNSMYNFELNFPNIANIDNGFWLILSSILFIGGFIVSSLNELKKVLKGIDKKLESNKKIEPNESPIDSSAFIQSSFDKKKILRITCISAGFIVGSLLIVTFIRTIVSSIFILSYDNPFLAGIIVAIIVLVIIAILILFIKYKGKIRTFFSLVFEKIKKIFKF